MVMILLLTGCSEEAEPLTPGVLDATVRAAAQQLLDSPGIEASSLGYDEDGELSITRWIGWRATGDIVLLSIGRFDSGGIVQVGDTVAQIGRRAVAGEMQEIETWTVVDTPPVEGFAFNANSIAAGDTLAGLADVEGDILIESEPTEGGVLYRMVVPLAAGTVTREWLIDDSGYLREWTWETSPGFVLASNSLVHNRFDPLSDRSVRGGNCRPVMKWLPLAV